MSTSTLAANISTLGQTGQDYFATLLTTLWPYILGFLIVLGAWYFIKRVVLSFR